MISRNICIDFLYFLGTCLLLLSGFLLKMFSPLGIGILFFYFGKKNLLIIKESKGNTPGYLKKYLLWYILVLVLSLVIYFSLIKVTLNILLRNHIIIWNQLIIYISLFGALYYEALFRLSLQKRNRFAAIVLLFNLIVSVGAFILGEHWFKTDLILGFLSLTLTVIISFRKAYLGLSDILS